MQKKFTHAAQSLTVAGVGQVLILLGFCFEWGLFCHSLHAQRTESSALQCNGGKAITQNQLWQICHTLLQQSHTALFLAAKA